MYTPGVLPSSATLPAGRSRSQLRPGEVTDEPLVRGNLVISQEIEGHSRRTYDLSRPNVDPALTTPNASPPTTAWWCGRWWPERNRRLPPSAAGAVAPFDRR